MTLHVDDAGPAHDGRAGLLQVAHLKEERHVVGQGNDLTVHQAQLPALIQYRVQVLDPGRVHGAVKDQPLPLIGGGGGHVSA